MDNLAINEVDKKEKNYFKMPTGNSNFTFNFKVDE
jgi:hypothetical protein